MIDGGSLIVFKSVQMSRIGVGAMSGGMHKAVEASAEKEWRMSRAKVQKKKRGLPALEVSTDDK